MFPGRLRSGYGRGSRRTLSAFVFLSGRGKRDLVSVNANFHADTISPLRGIVKRRIKTNKVDLAVNIPNILDFYHVNSVILRRITNGYGYKDSSLGLLIVVLDIINYNLNRFKYIF